MALQEVRWPGAGETAAGGYDFLWSGPPDGQPRRAGVALALDQVAYQSFVIWYPMDSRTMVVHFRHTPGSMSIVAIYSTHLLTRFPTKRRMPSTLDLTKSCLQPTEEACYFVSATSTQSLGVTVSSLAQFLAHSAPAYQMTIRTVS